MNPTEMIVVLANVGIGGLLMIIWSTQAHRRKQMAHLERMKAMEGGLVPSPTGLDWPAAAVCIAIGAGVPLGSFAIALLATLIADAPDGIWVAPVFVSFPAISAARKLADRIINPRSASKTPVLTGKPEFDPDAYDVVGSRG